MSSRGGRSPCRGALKGPAKSRAYKEALIEFMPVVQWNIATRWFGAPYFRWNGDGVRCRVVGSVQYRVLLRAIVAGLDGECACHGGCISDHGQWRSSIVVLMSVRSGSDHPFEVSLADVVKAMESAKAIISEDIDRAGGGRRSD